MKLTTKARFAVAALLDLARQTGPAPASLRQVGERLGVSLSYLEQLFVQLRRTALVESVRGPGGGYRLARRPEDIRIAEVVNAVDRHDPSDGGGAGIETELWDRLETHLMAYLEEVTLADMLSGAAAEPSLSARGLDITRAQPEVAAMAAANDPRAVPARVHAFARR